MTLVAKEPPRTMDTDETPPWRTTLRCLQIRKEFANLARNTRQMKIPIAWVEVKPVFQTGLLSKYRVHIKNAERRIVSSHFVAVSDPPESRVADRLAALNALLDSGVIFDKIDPALN